jgi:hypothetical protein
LKTIFYVIIPVIAILLILTNALYGHLLFSPTTDLVTNKYSIYVHLEPDWKSDSKNIIFEITNLWYKLKNENVNNFVNDHSTYNPNKINSIQNKSFVELKHSFSDCQNEWQPVLYRKVVDNVRNEIEYLQGKQLSPNPDFPIFPEIENTSYDKSQQKIKIKKGYAQFIPICTSKDSTSYEYSIKTNNESIGFDVYFVSSNLERERFSSNDFEYYEQVGCFGQNKQSFAGICNKVKKDGGLLIILPDELNPWVTNVTVNLYEKK